MVEAARGSREGVGWLEKLMTERVWAMMLG